MHVPKQEVIVWKFFMILGDRFQEKCRSETQKLKLEKTIIKI
jgi:hypothetical protein